MWYNVPVMGENIVYLFTLIPITAPSPNYQIFCILYQMPFKFIDSGNLNAAFVST